MTKISALVLAVVVVAVMAACSGSDAAPGVASEDWVTISGQGVSLSVPASFKGGDPADPAVMSLLRTLAQSRSDPATREWLTKWLDTVNMDEGGTPLLIAWAAPNDGNLLATLTINFAPLQNILAVTGGDRSMRRLVEAYMGPPDYWEIDSLDAQQATVVVRDKSDTDNGPAEFSMIKLSGDWYYRISCTPLSGAWTSWYPVFKKSSQTLKIRP